VPNCNWTGYECDVLAVTSDLRIIDIEVKVSRADFKVDAKKDKWWHRQFGHYDPETRGYVTPEPIHRPWPPKVWKHYYAIPRAIWSDDLFPLAASPASGVLLLDEPNPERPSGPLRIDCVRRSTPNRDASRLTPQQAIDVARLANLRMWEALVASPAAQCEPEAA